MTNYVYINYIWPQLVSSLYVLEIYVLGMDRSYSILNESVDALNFIVLEWDDR